MVDLVMSRDQEQIVEEATRLLDERFPISRLRAKTAGSAPDTVKDALVNAGWLSVAAPEAVGGAGLSVVEEALLFQQFGRFLAPPGVLAATLAPHAAIARGDQALAQAIVAGGTRVALAHRRAGPAGDQAMVFDREGADYVLLVDDDGGVTLAPVETLMDLRDAHSAVDGVSVAHARVSPVTAPLGERADLGWRARLLAAALLTGIAAGARDLASEYAKIRSQFGRPIGSFQAIKHKCADMALNADAAAALVNFSAAALDEGQDQAAFCIASAKLLAGRNAVSNGKECIQVHGAIGWTVECDAHHFLKRAHLYDQICGGVARQQALLMTLPAPLSRV